MPLESGSQILNYQGNANLALGGSPDVPVVGVGDTDEINKTARDLAVMSFARNKMQWEAKRQDLEETRKAIDDGNISIGDVLEHDRPIVQDAKSKIWDVYKKVGGNLLDPNNYAEFKKAVNGANEVVKQAQKNYVGVTGDLAMKKQTANPYDHEKIDQNIRSQMSKGFWANYNPYAPITDFDLKTVQPPVTYGQVQTKREGDYNVASQSVDVQRTLDNYQKNWADPRNREQFNRFVNDYFSHPNFQEDIKQKNAILDDINKRLGLQPGAKNYLTPIDPTKDRADQVAAKIALADSEPVLSKKEFAKEEVNAGIQRGELGERIRHDKAMEGMESQRLSLSMKAAENKGVPSSLTTSAQADVNALWKKLRSIGSATATSEGKDVLITYDELNRLTEREKRMLGSATGSGSQWELKQRAFDANKKQGLIVRGDGTIVLVDNARKEGNRLFYDKASAGNVIADQSQLFDNRLFDILQNTAGREPTLTNEGLPYLYNQFQSRGSSEKGGNTSGSSKVTFSYSRTATGANGQKAYLKDGSTWVDESGNPLQ
jgi:hypothetical protein